MTTPTTPQETQREFAWKNWPNDAEEILEEAEAPTTRCKQKGCRAPIRAAS